MPRACGGLGGGRRGAECRRRCGVRLGERGTVRRRASPVRETPRVSARPTLPFTHLPFPLPAPQNPARARPPLALRGSCPSPWDQPRSLESSPLPTRPLSLARGPSCCSPNLPADAPHGPLTSGNLISAGDSILLDRLSQQLGPEAPTPGHSLLPTLRVPSAKCAAPTCWPEPCSPKMPTASCLGDYGAHLPGRGTVLSRGREQEQVSLHHFLHL